MTSDLKPATRTLIYPNWYRISSIHIMTHQGTESGYSPSMCVSRHHKMNIYVQEPDPPKVLRNSVPHGFPLKTQQEGGPKKDTPHDSQVNGNSRRGRTSPASVAFRPLRAWEGQRSEEPEKWVPPQPPNARPLFSRYHVHPLLKKEAVTMEDRSVFPKIP